MFKPQRWTYEPLSIARARALSRFKALGDEISPLVASGDPLDLIKAQQATRRAQVTPEQKLTAQRSFFDRIAANVRTAAQQVHDQANASLDGAPMDVVQASDRLASPTRPTPGVPRGVAEASPETVTPTTKVYDSGSSAPRVNPFASLVDQREGLPKPVQKALDVPVLGQAITEVARPANWVGTGGWMNTLRRNVGASLGAQGFSNLTEQHMPDNAPGIVKAGAPLVAGLAGAVAGGGAADSIDSLPSLAERVKQAFRSPAAERASLRPVIAGATSPLSPSAVKAEAGSALGAAAEQAALQGPKATLPAGIARALDQSRTYTKVDQPGAIARAFYRVPGMTSLFRPGLKMPENIVESYVAEGAARAEFGQQAFASRRQTFNQLDQAFGNGATEGASLPLRFLGNADEAKYPGTGTLYDVMQRPEKYDLTPAQRSLIDVVDRRNEALRQNVVTDFGADIGQFKRPEGGAYLPNLDRSEAAQDIAEAVGQSERSAAASGRAKTRFYSTGYDRWVADQNAVAKGRLKPSEVFTPETNIRRLLEGMDSSKERMVGAQVFRAGLGGKTKLEVLQETHPELYQRMTSLRQRLQGLRGSAARLDERLQNAAREIASGQGSQPGLIATLPSAGTEAAPTAASDFRSTLASLPDLSEIQSQINELRAGLGRNAQGALLTNKQNRETIQTIADYEAWAEVKHAFDQSGGDAEKASEYLLHRLETWSNAAESRRNPGLRASLTNSRGAKQARARRMTGGLGTDPYTQVNNAAGDDEYAILSAKADALNSLYETVQADAAGPYIESAVQHFDSSPMNTADLDSVQAALDSTMRSIRSKLQEPTIGFYRGKVGRNYGKTAADLRAEVDSVKQDLADLRPSWDAANPRGYKFVGDGIYRYFPAEQSGQIQGLLKTDSSPIFRTLANINAGALSGDFSPLVGQQGQVAWLTAPLQTTKAVFGGMFRGGREGDLLRGFKSDALAEDVAKDPTSWGDFAFYTGRSTAPGNVPEEMAGGWIGKVPGVGKKFTTVNDSIYTAVIRAQKLMWDDKVDELVARGVDPQRAKAIAARNAMGVIPTPNRRAAGISQAQMEGLRAPLTSLTFVQRPAQMITNAAEGMANMVIPGKTVTETQRLAIKSVVRMNATALALSASTAAIYAQSKGLDPEQAALDAINPTNKNFMAITLPDGIRVPIGGPYRAMFKALSPAPVKTEGGHEVWLPFAGTWNFVRNRVSPAVRTQVDLLRNQDFYGNKIMSADFPLNVLQAAEYEVEGAVPLTAGGVASGIRTGADVKDTLANSLGGALGANVRLPSATDKLNELAQQQYGKGYFDLEPYQRRAIDKANPDIAQAKLDASNEKPRAAAAVKDEYSQRQQALDSQLLSGTIKREDYVNQYYTMQTERAAKLEQIYGDKPITDPKTPMDKYAMFIQQSKDPQTGQLDFDKLESKMSSLTADERDYLQRNIGLDDTPVAKEFRAMRALRKQRNSIEKYRGYTADQANQIDELWQEVRNNSRSADELPMRRSLRALSASGNYDPAIVRGVQRRISGMLKQLPLRSRFDKQHPEMAIFYGRGRLTQAEIAALNEAA